MGTGLRIRYSSTAYTIASLAQLKVLVALLFCTGRFTAAAQVSPAPWRSDALIEYYRPLNNEQRELVLWQEDFANGIPANWTNTESGGIAQWEYRGTATTPNINTGSRGSCFINNAPGSDPIQSESWQNGFVIFDSNWWDDPNGPCGNLGSGTAPAPHLAYLQTSSIDMSSFQNVGLMFTQYIKNYLTDTRVEVSVNGGTWTEVWANNLTIQQLTSPQDVQRVNIAALASGQSDVRIRFVFDGSYYFWMIDDIQLVQLEENNLHIADCTYGAFDFDNAQNPTGFEWMEYGQYPVAMAPLLKFSCTAHNYGVNEQTGVVLLAEVQNTLTEQVIFNSSTAQPVNLPASTSESLAAGQFQMPGSIGHYNINYRLAQFQPEDSPADNADTLKFRITDVTYARDKGAMLAAYLPFSQNVNQPFETGNVYLITQTGIQAHSISVAVANGSQLPATIYGSIYSIEVDDVVNVSWVASTTDAQLSSGLLNQPGGEQMVTMSFTTPVNLQQGKAYLVVVGCAAGHEHMLVGVNGQSPDLTTWRKYGNDSWGYINSTVMVRLNIGAYTDFSETELLPATLYPNPADKECTLQLPGGIWQLKVKGTDGRVVWSETFSYTSSQTKRLDTSALAPGLYLVHLRNQNIETVLRLVVQR